MAIRVAVVDRRRLVREGLAAALSAHPGIEVVAALASPAALPGHAVDAYLWGEVTTAALPEARVLRLTGAETIEGLVSRLRDHADEDTSVPERSRLTLRETQVIGALAEGLPTGEIADVLGIAAKSVDHHKQRAYAKLGVRNAAHAVAAVAGAAR
jgi:DNA-binding NarL/FixJ family response regulator